MLDRDQINRDRRDKFDRDFERMERRVWRVSIAGVIVALAMIAAIGYVAIHFLAKVW